MYLLQVRLTNEFSTSNLTLALFDVSVSYLLAESRLGSTHFRDNEHNARCSGFERWMITVDVDPFPDRVPLFSRPSYVSLSNLEILLWCTETHTFAMLLRVRSLRLISLQSSSM